jgi:hypothetical protein
MAEWRRTGLDNAGIQQPESTPPLMPPEWSRSYCPDRHQQAEEDLAPKASEIDQRSLEGRHPIPRGDQRFDSRLFQERVERTSN